MTSQPRLLCVATHHKGGTVWIKQVVTAIAKALDIPLIGMWSDRQIPNIPAFDRAILVNWHGWFPAPVWADPQAMFFHVIRDPRDILISGCQYHHVAGPKGEKFLHTPRADLDGKTYQQAICGIEGSDDKLLFEMREKHAETLREMRNWPMDHPRSLTLRYEDLMVDETGQLFRLAMAHWGLSPAEQDIAAQIFWEKSLFGGLAVDTARKGHVQSGKITRWRDELPYAVGRVYAREHGHDLIALGYETKTDWVDALPKLNEINRPESGRVTECS